MKLTSSKVERLKLEDQVRQLKLKYQLHDNSSHCHKEQFHEYNSVLDRMGRLTLLEFLKLFRDEAYSSISDDMGVLNSLSKYDETPAFNPHKSLGRYDVMVVMYCYAYGTGYDLDIHIGNIWRNFMYHMLDSAEYMYRLTGEISDIERFRVMRFESVWEIGENGELKRDKCCPTCGQTLDCAK